MIQNLNRSELLLKLLYLDALCIVNLRFINNTAPCDKYSPMKSDSDPELPDMASFCSLQSTAPVVFQTSPGCLKSDHLYSPSPAVRRLCSILSAEVFRQKVDRSALVERIFPKKRNIRETVVLVVCIRIRQWEPVRR